MTTSHDSMEPVQLSSIEAKDPEPLVFGKLDGVDHTIMFGDGGTGKGVIAAEWVAHLTNPRPGDGLEAPEAVLVLDYERHTQYEWRPRVEAFGGDLDRVFVLQPPKSILDDAIIDRLAVEVAKLRERFKCRVWLVVDSVVYAVAPLKAESSEVAASYSNAIGVIGAPTLSLAHVTKADADPRHPFGSGFWSNGARVTIGVSRVGEELDSNRRVVNKKTNQRAPFRSYEIPWMWVHDGLPEALETVDAGADVADQRARDAIWMQGYKTAKEIHALVSADGLEPVGEDAIYKALTRNTRKYFARDPATKGRGKVARWKAGPDVTKSVRTGVPE